MSKKRFDNSNKNISEDIYNDYIYDNGLDKDDHYDEKLNVLVTNNLAWKTSGSDSLLSSNQNTYRVACKFIQKYNKNNKNIEDV